MACSAGITRNIVALYLASPESPSHTGGALYSSGGNVYVTVCMFPLSTFHKRQHENTALLEEEHSLWHSKNHPILESLMD